MNKPGMPPAMYEGLTSFLRRWTPRYDELTTYLAAMSVLLVFLSYPGLRAMYLEAWSWSSREEQVVLVLVLSATVLVPFAMAVCLGSILTRRPGEPEKKTVMGMFTMGVCGTAGIAAAVENLPEQVGWSWAFPVFNIMAGLLLLYQMILVPEGTVTDRQASPAEAVVATVGLVLVLVVSQWCFRLGWGMALSVCLTYAGVVGVIAARTKQQTDAGNGCGQH